MTLVVLIFEVGFIMKRFFILAEPKRILAFNFIPQSFMTLTIVTIAD